MEMNQTDLLGTPENEQEVLAKHIVIVSMALVISGINGMLVYTFFRNPEFQTDPRYILYIYLVINDILFICLTVSLYLVSYISPYVNASLCFLLMAIGTASFLISPLILAGMAVERFIAVCKPLHHLQICTVKRTYILICVISGFGTIPAITDIFIVMAVKPLSHFNSLTCCQPYIIYNTKYHMQREISVQSLYLSVVWITLFYTYFRVLFIARMASSGNQKSSAKKARNTILLHGGQLLLCMLSYLTPVMDWILIPFFPASRMTITHFNYLLTNIVPRLLSPLIYGARDQKFLKHIKHNFSCKLIIIKVAP